MRYCVVEIVEPGSKWDIVSLKKLNKVVHNLFIFAKCILFQTIVLKRYVELFGKKHCQRWKVMSFTD